MSRLPNAERVIIADAKLRDYLLQEAHPQNRGKARFFAQFGFRPTEWRALAAALRMHPQENPVATTRAAADGERYVVRCQIRSPDGRDPCEQSIWFVQAGAPPRFLTAYPARSANLP